MSERRLIFSADIETTGLDEFNCQILEIGLIAWDLDLPCEPLSHMKRFHTYVKHSEYIGEAFAFSMHPTILRRIAIEEKPYQYLNADRVTSAIRNWVEEIQGLNDKGQADCTFAGKNFARFDSRFLNRLPSWATDVKESHRSFDPAILYYDPRIDRKLPDMKTCLERAAARTVARTGVDQGFGLLETRHDAIGDAELVIKLLRAAWGIDENGADTI